MNIRKTLLKFNDHALPENFVALAVQIDSVTFEPSHAGILIRFLNKNYLHHFPGANPPEVIEDFNEDGWYVYKIMDFVQVGDSSEVGAFLQYCKSICQKTQITYGFIADGSKYDLTGDYLNNSELPEFGTCVGFCLNTLANTIIDIEESIVELDDWDNTINSKYEDWSREQANSRYPDLNWNLYDSFTKRITPLEYLCTSFFTEYPITKKQILNITPKVKESIILIYGQSS